MLNVMKRVPVRPGDITDHLSNGLSGTYYCTRFGVRISSQYSFRRYNREDVSGTRNVLDKSSTRCGSTDPTRDTNMPDMYQEEKGRRGEGGKLMILPPVVI